MPTGSLRAAAKDDGIELCLPDRTARTHTYGWNLVRKDVDTTVVLVSVEPVNGRNLRLVDAAWTPLEPDQSQIGTAATFPPTMDRDLLEPSKELWRRRLPAGVGAPTSAHLLNIVVGVSRASDESTVGSADGLSLKYSEGGSTRVVQTTTKVRLDAADCPFGE